jgi:hypothetical protein
MMALANEAEFEIPLALHGRTRLAPTVRVRVDHPSLVNLGGFQALLLEESPHIGPVALLGVGRQRRPDRAQPGRSSLTRSVSRTPCPHRPVTTHLSPCHRPSVTQGRQLCAWLADHRSSQRCLSNTKARRPRALELSLLAASWRSVSTFSGGTAAKEHDGPTAACGSRSKADPRSPVAPRTGPYDDRARSVRLQPLFVEACSVWNARGHYVAHARTRRVLR